MGSVEPFPVNAVCACGADSDAGTGGPTSQIQRRPGDRLATRPQGLTHDGPASHAAHRSLWTDWAAFDQQRGLPRLDDQAQRGNLPRAQQHRRALRLDLQCLRLTL